MGGRTNKVTHVCLGRNLSHSTYEWKDESSHQQVFWYKIYVLLTTSGRTNQITHECFVRNLSPSTYGWKDESSHLRAPWSKFKVLLPTGGKTNQATSKCLGTKFKSFYLQVEGRTNSLTSILVKIFRSSYRRVDQPSRPRVPWWKFEVFLPTGEQTSLVIQKGLGQNLIPLRHK